MLCRQVAQNFRAFGWGRVGQQALTDDKQFGDPPRVILAQSQAIDLIVNQDAAHEFQHKSGENDQDDATDQPLGPKRDVHQACSTSAVNM